MFIREEWPFRDKRILINNHIYICYNLYIYICYNIYIYVIIYIYIHIYIYCNIIVACLKSSLNAISDFSEPGLSNQQSAGLHVSLSKNRYPQHPMSLHIFSPLKMQFWDIGIYTCMIM